MGIGKHRVKGTVTLVMELGGKVNCVAPIELAEYY
jgi:hypothetical protein